MGGPYYRAFMVLIGGNGFKSNQSELESKDNTILHASPGQMSERGWADVGTVLKVVQEKGIMFLLHQKHNAEGVKNA